VRKGFTQFQFSKRHLSTWFSELKFSLTRYIANKPFFIHLLDGNFTKRSLNPKRMHTFRVDNEAKAQTKPELQTSKRRRRLMLICLSVGSLLLVGLIRQPAFEKVPETLTSVTNNIQQLQENVQESFEASLAQRKSARVGLQIGHLEPENQPDELAGLRYSTGGYAHGISEVNVNKATALLLKEMLEFEGISVDILPATVPPNYEADLVIAIHSDSSPDTKRRGYKSAHFRYPRNKWEPILKADIDKAYFYFSGLPDDDENVSGSMLEYYAFNRASYKHTVSRTTPAIIVEMGYISNDKDMAFLSDPVNPAYALKRGILTYLAERGKFVLKD
jgi:hypothetical protein